MMKVHFHPIKRMLRSVSSTLVLICCIFSIASAGTFNVGFVIEHASVHEVDGIYVCSSDSRCSSVTPSNALTLVSSHSYVNGEIQKRWFIRLVNGRHVADLYGAIELASEPEIKLKTWKRLGLDAAFEPDMTLTSIGSYPQSNRTEGYNTDVLLLNANVLLVAYQLSTLDRRSERGRYIYGALLHYHALFENRQYEDNQLVQLFDCDYMSVLGSKSRAGDCYANALAQLGSGISFANDTSSAAESYIVSGDFSALQCMPALKNFTTVDIGGRFQPYSNDLLSCHKHYATIRHMRHMLIHQLDPLHVVNIATINNHLLEVDECKVWTLLALCMIGHCNTDRLLYSPESGALSFRTEVSSHNTTIHIEVAVSTVVTECDAILSYLSAHGDNEMVHTLFTKTCFPFRRLHNSITNMNREPQELFDSTQSYVDHSRSIINSLLSIGAIETAAFHSVHFTQHLLGLTDITDSYNAISLTSELDRLYNDYKGVSVIIDTTPEANNRNLLTSPNIRAALSLSALLRSILSTNEYAMAFARSSDVLSNFVSVLFHATSPVILSLPPVHTIEHKNNTTALDYVWLQEAVILRIVMINALQTLINLCDSLCANCCIIQDPTSNIGGRGLFLLAYQGLGLTLESVRMLHHRLREGYNTNDSTSTTPLRLDFSDFESIVSDKTVPSLYAQLILRTSNRDPLLIHNTSNTGAVEFSTEMDLSTSNTTMAATVARNDRIKVGFVSFFFRRHPVGRLLSKIITQLDTAVFNVYLIIQQDLHSLDGTTVTKQDPVTKYLYENVPKSNILRIPRDEISALSTLRTKNFDIIVYGDIFMDAFIAHLAMYRIGKVQVAFWGHPYTSGYDSIDYFISSDQFESQRDKYRHQHYQEQLVLFDSLSFQLLLERPGTADTSYSTRVDSDKTSNTSGNTSTLYKALPAYTPRSVQYLWAQGTNTSTSANISTAFYTRRREVLMWITAIGYDIYDMPINDITFCKALLPAPADTATCISHPANKTQATSISTILERVHFYGALQSLFKMHPMFDLAIYHILLTDPYAIILLSRNGKQNVWEESFRIRLVTTITTLWKHDKTHNIATKSATQPTLKALLGRVLFVNQMQHVQYEQLVCSMDVTLDTFPFGGGVTLSDGLGGCGVHMNAAHMHNTSSTLKVEINSNTTTEAPSSIDSSNESTNTLCANTHYISPIVPFVTSGQLQSVHQIGAGIASKLGHNMKNYAYSVPDMVYKHSMKGDLNSSENSAILRSKIHTDTFDIHMYYVREYVTGVISLATTSHVSKMYVRGNCHTARTNAKSVEKKINDILYDGKDAAREWSDFLKRIAL